MSSAKREPPEIDVSLLDRVASLPPSAQRWLKTALEAIETIDPAAEQEEAAIEMIDPAVEQEEEAIETIDPAAEQEEKATRPPPAEMPPPPPHRVGLDDMLSGNTDLSELAEAYPDLIDELRDISDMASLLQDAGRARRSLGEQILREQLLEDREPEEEREDKEGG
jgi:hypothetical protein